MIKLGGKDLILEGTEQNRAYNMLSSYTDKTRSEWGYLRSVDLGYGRLAHKFKRVSSKEEEYLTIVEVYDNGL